MAYWIVELLGDWNAAFDLGLLQNDLVLTQLLKLRRNHEAQDSIFAL